MSSDEGEGEAAAFTGYWTGPKPDVKYPLNVIYCGECSMPMEFCEYWPAGDKCKEWALKNAPDAIAKLSVAGETEEEEAAAARMVAAKLKAVTATRRERGRLGAGRE